MLTYRSQLQTKKKCWSFQDWVSGTTFWLLTGDEPLDRLTFESYNGACLALMSPASQFWSFSCPCKSWFKSSCMYPSIVDISDWAPPFLMSCDPPGVADWFLGSGAHSGSARAPPQMCAFGGPPLDVRPLVPWSSRPSKLAHTLELVSSVPLEFFTRTSPLRQGVWRPLTT